MLRIVLTVIYNILIQHKLLFDQHLVNPTILIYCISVSSFCDFCIKSEWNEEKPIRVYKIERIRRNIVKPKTFHMLYNKIKKK